MKREKRVVLFRFNGPSERLKFAVQTLTFRNEAHMPSFSQVLTLQLSTSFIAVILFREKLMETNASKMLQTFASIRKAVYGKVWRQCHPVTPSHMHFIHTFCVYYCSLGFVYSSFVLLSNYGPCSYISFLSLFGLSFLDANSI